MSILLDQCVPRKYQKLLTEWGYTTTLLQAHIAADSPDSSVIQLAQTLDALLLTVDLDFSNVLNYPPKDYGGIMVLRHEESDESALHATLKQALQDLYRDGLRGALVIVSPHRYRIRRSEG